MAAPAAAPIDAELRARLCSRASQTRRPQCVTGDAARSAEAARTLRAGRDVADRPGHSELDLPHVLPALERPGRRQTVCASDDRTAAAVVDLAHVGLLAAACCCSHCSGLHTVCRRIGACRPGDRPPLPVPARAGRRVLRAAGARTESGSVSARRVEEAPHRAGEVRTELRRSGDGHACRQRRPARGANGSARAVERSARHSAGRAAMDHRAHRH